MCMSKECQIVIKKQAKQKVPFLTQSPSSSSSFQKELLLSSYILCVFMLVYVSIPKEIFYAHVNTHKCTDSSFFCVHK